MVKMGNATLIGHMQSLVDARRDGTGHPELLIETISAGIQQALKRESDQQISTWLQAFDSNMADASWRYLDEVKNLLKHSIWNI
jgi:hypothetical protein